MFRIILVFFLLQSNFIFSQKDNSSKWSFSGYGEIYYSYDFAKPANHDKASFIYNHKRHNEFNTNLLLAKVNYFDKNTRATLGVMAGNYAQYNLSAEPNWAQFIYEANMGIKLSKKTNLWLDVGIMPSHIGFESAISADCWTLTRSVLAENSPYYETGVKVNYTNKNEKLLLNFFILNGWQKIQRPDSIQTPALGIQVNYKANENTTFNYSNFIGSDKPSSKNATRLFHNFYMQYEPNKKFGILAGFDIGTEKNIAQKWNTWFAPIILLKHTINDKWKMAFRQEYYNDSKQIIVTTNTVNGFVISGSSLNIDYTIRENVQWRTEGKMYQSKDNIFQNNLRKNFSITTNLTVRF